MIILKNIKLTNISILIKNNKDEILYLFSQFLTPGVGFLVNLVLMKQTSPEVIGTHQSVVLWSTYMAFLQLGVYNGLNRNLAYFLGGKQVDKFDNAVATSFVFTLFISFIQLLIVLGIALSAFNDGSVLSMWAFVYLAVFAFTQPISVFLDTFYRTTQRFKKLSWFLLIDNGIYGINIFMIFIWGYFGFVIQSLIKMILEIFIRGYGIITSLKFRFSFTALKEQIQTGFPIMINGYLYTTFFVFDQFYITKNFSKEELGFYNLARLVLFVLPIIPTALSTILYPKASALYGSSGDDVSVLKSFFIKSLVINCLVVVPLVITIYFLIGPVTTFFLPKYVGGIGYAKLSVWGGLGFIMVGPSIILGVLKANRVNLIGLIALIIFSYGFYFSGILHFNKIEVLIYFKNTIFIGYSCFTLFYIYFFLLNKKNPTL